MKKSELYLEAAAVFAPKDRTRQAQIAPQLRAWAEGEARAIRELGAIERLRCYVYITKPMADGELVCCEFAAPGGRNHIVTVASSGRNAFFGQRPHTIGFAASIKLVALLAKEIGMPVTLHP